jgi:hypothetical protein
VWDTGGAEIKAYPIKDAQPLCAALFAESGKLIGGDTAGQVHFWNLEPKQ